MWIGRKLQSYQHSLSQIEIYQLFRGCDKSGLIGVTNIARTELALSAMPLFSQPSIISKSSLFITISAVRRWCSAPTLVNPNRRARYPSWHLTELVDVEHGKESKVLNNQRPSPDDNGDMDQSVIEFTTALVIYQHGIDPLDNLLDLLYDVRVVFKNDPTQKWESIESWI